MCVAARTFKVPDFRHVQTITAAKRSGKFPFGVLKEECSNSFSRSIAARYDVAAFIETGSSRDGLCRRLHQKQIQFRY
jgi:hypothetical protein